MLKKNSYLILGIGTEVGKTFFVENLCRALPNSLAIKPIASGFSKNDKNSDTAKIAAILGEKDFDEITPWRFKEPVSPHFAGEVDFTKLKKFCLNKISQAKKEKRFLFIESAGGVMTPINAKKTFIDLACELKIPVLLVSSNYLGAISHTLCAVTALKSKKLVVEKIILNENFPSQINAAALIKTISNFSGIETISIKNFFKK